ncbi:MAG: PAS domain S-box protein [Methanobacteriaceae archaeon]|nr:PAS domain S-box protein [Methanobacteriaceae archaeon]
MKLEGDESKSIYKIIIILTLIALACILTYYFHFILRTGIIFTHFYYIPIILAAIWWKRKGFWVPLFLIGVLFFSDFVNPIKSDPWFDDFSRSLVFISVSVITVILSERIEKSLIKLAESEEKFRSVFESAAEAIITIDSKGNVVYWNKEAQNIFGYSKEEIIGQSITLIMPRRFRKAFKEGMMDMVSSNRTKFSMSSPKMRALRKNDDEFPFEYKGSVWESEGERYYTVLVKDITDKIKADEISSTLTAIVENSNDAIIGKDLDGIVLSWNQGAEKIYGYKEDEMIGKSISRIFPPGSDELEQILDKISRGETIDHYRTHRVTKTGDVIDISLTSSPIKDSFGNIVGVSSISRDITSQMEAERALEKSEAQLTLLTSNMADIICQADSEGNYIYVSPSVKSVLGYEPDEMMGRSMFDFVHPDDLKAVTSCMQDAAGKCISQSATYRLRKADGNYIWIGTTGKPLFNERGDLSGFVCNSRDITQQKYAEDALRESEEKYRSLIESAQDPISILDRNGVFLLTNRASAQRFNMEPPEMLGKSLRELFPETADKQLKVIRKVFDTGEGLEVEMPVKYDQHDRYYSVSAQPIFGPENTVQTVQVIARDITDIKQTQMQLEQALHDKDMLMKEIYHRVKNNLMVISSLLNLQSSYIKDEEAKGIFKESQDRAHSMALIHERLYRSKDLKHMDFGDYIRSLAMDLFRTYVSDPSRIKLEMEVEDILIDINTAIPLGLIVNELLSNSMKHAFPRDKSGVIKVKFYKKDDESCILEVSDTGVGFPKDLELDKTESLGLQLVNNLTRQINGELELERTPGTTFRIRFKEKRVSK